MVLTRLNILTDMRGCPTRLGDVLLLQKRIEKVTNTKTALGKERAYCFTLIELWLSVFTLPCVDLKSVGFPDHAQFLFSGETEQIQCVR